MASRFPFARLAILAALTAAYFGAGRLGLTLAFVHLSATAVWPPTGIAIAALLLLGVRAWPAIYLGAFLVNLTTSGSIPASLGIAAGNTLEGVLAASLTERFAGGRFAFERAQNILRFVVLAGVASTTVSATIGVGSLVLTDLASPASAGPIWLTWWLGDAVGALVVTPLILLWATRPLPRWTGRRLGEALLLAGAVVAIAVAVFGGWNPTASWRNPIEFLCIPPVIWASFRFGAREAVTAAFILAAVSIRGTLAGLGPFAAVSPNESLVLLQAFMGTVTSMGAVIGALVTEQREAEEGVRRLNEDLERRVATRTVQLQRVNDDLVREIGERGRAEAELAAAQGRLLEAQQLAHIGNWDWDITHDTLWWSDELFRIYGLDPTTLRPSYAGFLERVHPEDRDRMHSVVSDALARLESFEVEHRIVRPDGAVRVLLGRGRVVTDGQGRPIRMVGTGQDITERKRAEEEMQNLAQEQAARREAETANRMKDEFLTVVSHELRTPLTAILGWSRLLALGLSDPEMTRRAVETIERNARMQARLIDDILDVSGMLTGKVVLDAREIDPAAVVASALEAMRPAADSKGVRLGAHISQLPPRMMADPARLEQILLNLLSNAVKFTPAGGEVELEAMLRGEDVQFRVRDTGVGISPEFLPHVFDRFRQADTSTTRVHGGLGLGLAIVRSLVKAHGGTIVAESAGHGSGSTFTVRLPVGIHRLVSVQMRDSAAPSPTPAGADALDSVRVLVLDDDEAGRELLKATLVQAGALVVDAASVREAVDALARQRVDAMLVDIGMPEEDGYSFLRRVKQGSIPGSAGVPIVAVTAYVSQDDVQRGTFEGFDAYLKKPFDPHVVVRTVARMTQQMKKI